MTIIFYFPLNFTRFHFPFRAAIAIAAWPAGCSPGTPPEPVYTMVKCAEINNNRQGMGEGRRFKRQVQVVARQTCCTHPEERLLPRVLGQPLLHARVVGRHLLLALRQPAPAGLLVLLLSGVGVDLDVWSVGHTRCVVGVSHKFAPRQPIPAPPARLTPPAGCSPLALKHAKNLSAGFSHCLALRGKWSATRGSTGAGDDMVVAWAWAWACTYESDRSCQLRLLLVGMLGMCGGVCGCKRRTATVSYTRLQWPAKHNPIISGVCRIKA